MKKFSSFKALVKIGATMPLWVLAVTVPASAHVGLSPVDTLDQGFLHPMSGIDHIIAMVAVGLFAAQIGGAALWLVPCAFVGTMILGGALGYYGWSLPMVEETIGLSVVVMSFAFALGVRLPTIAAMALVGMFAILHGHAHGSEGAGLGISFLPYAAGFVAATALLHTVGVTVGLAIDRLDSQLAYQLRRTSGSLGVFAGVSLLLGWLSA